MTEAEYLANYDPKAFKAQLLTVDAVLFTYHDQQLKVLLVQRSNHPFMFWGLPGGFIDELCDQSLEEAVLRKLQEKNGSSAALY